MILLKRNISSSILPLLFSRWITFVPAIPINKLTVAVINPTIIEATVRIDDKKLSLLTLSTSKPNVKTMLTQRKKISILYLPIIIFIIFAFTYSNNG